MDGIDFSPLLWACLLVGFLVGAFLATIILLVILL